MDSSLVFLTSGCVEGSRPTQCPVDATSSRLWQTVALSPAVERFAKGPLKLVVLGRTLPGFNRRACQKNNYGCIARLVLDVMASALTCDGDLGSNKDNRRASVSGDKCLP
jgi:hypothetical protein